MGRVGVGVGGSVLGSLEADCGGFLSGQLEFFAEELSCLDVAAV